MIRAIFLVLVCVPAIAQITKTAAPSTAGGPPPAIGTLKPLKISIASFLPVEKRFDQQLATLFDANDRLDLLGLTRGTYLEGYGVVFTAEVSLVITPSKNPFMQTIPKEMAERVRQRKIERLPVLKNAMKDMMATAARAFMILPPDHQIVLVIRFLYEPWEDRTGMPSQVLMRANRRGALDGDVQMEEQ